MGTRKVYRAIGLMSGTSLDGVDAALLETDGYDHVRPLGFYTAPYDDAARAAIRACFGLRDRDDARVKAAERLLTEKHVEAVKALLSPPYAPQQAGGIDLIGFHGQTIAHDPDHRFTLQIGDAELLAKETGVDVVHDFRSADVAAGGQGAPLLPLYHCARARAAGLALPAAIVNIGGVANVTWIGADGHGILAFDTGPGNALMDDWMQSRTGARFDQDGQAAARGKPDETLLAQWLGHPYFTQAPPKSLDRGQWDIAALGPLAAQAHDLSTEDGAATLLEFTARPIVDSVRFMPQAPKVWYVCGGGAHNKTLMRRLGAELPAVQSVDALGWNGDALEAEGFAYLAVRSALGEPISLPTTTGAPKPMPGGRLARAR